MISILNAGSDEVVFSSPRKSNLFNNGKLMRSHSVSYLSDGRVFIDGHPKAYISPATMWGEVIKRSTSTAKIDEALREGAEEEAAEGEHPPVITEEEEGSTTPTKLLKHHGLHLWRHPVKLGEMIKGHPHRQRSGSA